MFWKFQYQQQPKSIDVFVDVDFAARKTMLRSTSGIAEFYGRSPIEFGSSTQSVRALSMGESLSSMQSQKGSAHSLHSQAILKGSGMVVEAVFLSDASSGIGVASKQGCGRLKISRSSCFGCRIAFQRKHCDFASIPQKPTLLHLQRSTCQNIAWKCC